MLYLFTWNQTFKSILRKNTIFYRGADLQPEVSQLVQLKLKFNQIIHWTRKFFLNTSISPVKLTVKKKKKNLARNKREDGNPAMRRASSRQQATKVNSAALVCVIWRRGRSWPSQAPPPTSNMWFVAAGRQQKVNRPVAPVLVVKCTCEEMENSLLCTESLSVSRGEADPVIFADRRVLDNLLADEARSMLAEDYFTTNQTDLTPNMRSVVVTWMMEVCTLHLITSHCHLSCSYFVALSVAPMNIYLF